MNAQTVELLDYLGEDVRQDLAIGIVVEEIFAVEIFAPVTVRGDMIESVADVVRHGTGKTV